MAQRKKRQSAPNKAELEYLYKVKQAQVVNSLGRELIKYGGLVFAARYVYLSIDSLAGKSTFAEIGLAFLARSKFYASLGWLVGICGVAFGFYCLWRMKNTIERYQGHINQLETRIDPHRSSSAITVRGNTRPEDKI